MGTRLGTGGSLLRRSPKTANDLRGHEGSNVPLRRRNSPCYCIWRRNESRLGDRLVCIARGNSGTCTLRELYCNGRAVFGNGLGGQNDPEMGHAHWEMPGGARRPPVGNKQFPNRHRFHPASSILAHTTRLISGTQTLGNFFQRSNFTRVWVSETRIRQCEYGTVPPSWSNRTVRAGTVTARTTGTRPEFRLLHMGRYNLWCMHKMHNGFHL